MREAVKGLVSIVAALAIVFLMAMPGLVWAGHSGGHGGGGHSGGGHTGGGHGGGGHHGGSHAGHYHHLYGYGAAFVGGALLYPWPYSYGFYPLRGDLQPVGPVVYVEQFAGMPTAETKGWFYCPAEAASYPEVVTCPGGWQRVFTLEEALPQARVPQSTTLPAP